jgi:cell division protein FtsL
MRTYLLAIAFIFMFLGMATSVSVYKKALKLNRETKRIDTEIKLELVELQYLDTAIKAHIKSMKCQGTGTNGKRLFVPLVY